MVQKLVFVATAWGSRHGGLNTVNSELCIALAQALPGEYKVICVVLEATTEEIVGASKKGVVLQTVGQVAGQSHFEPSRAYEVSRLVATSCGDGEVAWWIGHDLITGNVASEARKISGRGRLAIFHHMNYFAYSAIKHQDGELTLRRAREQSELFSLADVVFAVGPKLADSARSSLAPSKSSKVVEIIPGLPEVRSQQSPTTFKAITFGRMGSSDDAIKQGRLAVAAFSRAVAEDPEIFGNDASLLVIGALPTEVGQSQESSLELANRYAGRVVNIVVSSYIEDRDQLLNTLASASVCMMLSLHEGFGLTGWEAIASGVPLIVSRNSGLFEFIDKHLGGPGIGCLTGVNVRGGLGEEHFSEDDVRETSEALKTLKLRLPQAKQNAKKLEELLRKTCTWRNMALSFATTCGLASTFVADQSVKYVEELEQGFIDEIVPSRSQHFEQLWQQLEDQSIRQRLVVLFGGISSALCNEGAAKRYATWLIRNREAQLFVCYEAGESAQLRAAILDERILDETGGLPKRAKERMAEKEKKVLALRQFLADLVSSAVLARVHFIPLTRAVTNYIMITDLSIFSTPVLQRRSSSTMSMRLPRQSSPLSRQLFGYILFQLGFIQHSDPVLRLREELGSEPGDENEKN